MKDYPSHPYADLFPMMTTAEVDALSEDIAANGLRHPVVLYGGKVLDGRNRMLACKKAGVKPAFTEHEGDDASALALVISLNVQRRELTSAQRAIVAARAMPQFEELAKKRMSEGGKKKGGEVLPTHRARDDAAKTFKVSDKSVQQAKAILAHAPDLAAQVESCTLSLAAAYDQLQQRAEQEKTRQAEATRKAKEADRIAEYREAVSAGELSFDDAMQKALAEERDEREKLAAEADARTNWLRGLGQALHWVETYIGKVSDPNFEWYTQPGSPGLFAHGITPDRIDAVILQLGRARSAFQLPEER